ncbi:MAG TPA: type VI secretion system tip protein TssI/VgrG [Actinomycetota bacterium]|jgi:type VI secretion system secreted protein VgrG
MPSPLTLTTPLGSDVFFVQGFTGSEGISRPFAFDLDLRALNSAQVAFEKLLGQPMTLSMAMPGGGTRFFSGVCSRFSQGRRDATLTSYRARLVPRLSVASLLANSRIFQQQTTPEILRNMFPAALGTPPDVTFQLKATYRARNYCVQYRESDFDFASRLMEEEGIFYFFRHDRSGHHLVLGDSPDFPTVPGPSPVAFSPTPPTHPDTATVFDWETAQELRSGRVTLRDHHFELPDETLEVHAATQDAVRVGTVVHHLSVGGNDKLELYDYPGGYAKRFDGITPGGGEDPSRLQLIAPQGSATGAIRIGEEAAQAIAVEGSSTCRQFTGGHQFTLKGHFAGNGKYYIVGVTHRASVAGDPRRATQSSVDYHNTFSAGPVALPFRPARSTPRPVVQGTQTAVVVGPAGGEVFTDEYGRVKVQFFWDREGKKDQNSSCWIRVGALHAGQENGFVTTPRIGDEVIVSFLEGDPDQPIIVGSVYNADRRPPPPGTGD